MSLDLDVRKEIKSANFVEVCRLISFDLDSGRNKNVCQILFKSADFVSKDLDLGKK